MKKYACLLLFALLLNGCDDGDLTVETFDFSTVNADHCDDTFQLIYKIKGQESLLLQLPEETLENQVTPAGAPVILDIDSAHKLFYRTYDGTVSKANICDAIRPSTPNVTDEWSAASGQIEISTTVNYTVNETENSTRISGYTHNIVFKNLTYSKPSGDQIGPSFIFGDIVTPAVGLKLDFEEAAEQCGTSKQIYNYSTGNATSLTIDNIDPNLIVNEVTPPNSPRTALITSTNNKVAYKVYEGVLTSSYFCNTTTPTSPAVTQTWNGENGVAGQSGIIEVVTATLGPNVFTHTITLKNVILNNGNVSFKLGNSFLLGIVTVDTN